MLEQINTQRAGFNRLSKVYGGRSMMRQSETLRKPAADQMTGTSSDLMAENI